MIVPHELIRAEARCDLGRICVRDRRSKRIDRFFAANPDEADNYLDHPYFEARVLAAKRATIFLLAPLLNDPEPDVRAMVAHRLPVNRIAALAARPRSQGSHGGGATIGGWGTGADAVRSRLLGAPCRGRDGFRRTCLSIAMNDPDPQVRREVARRIKSDVLPAMAVDSDPLVRLAVAERLDPMQLMAMVADEDLRVRFVVAERGNAAARQRLRNDPDPEVRRCARAGGAPAVPVDAGGRRCIRSLNSAAKPNSSSLNP